MGLLKIGSPVLPLVPRRQRRGQRAVRAGCWLGALALVVWGGANTLVGNLVLTGVVQPADGYDRSGMIGHAWLWDPMFLLWGLLLGVGLRLRRRSP